MAEKAFKVPSLGLVGTTAELDFASGDLRWNTLPLATESYVDSAVSGVTVNVQALVGDGLVYDAANNEIDVNTNVIATRAYVDAVAEGLHIHESVRAATTGPVALATALEAGDTLDTNVTLIAGDRILVKNQATASENGIYVVQASGQPTRATDFDTATEVDSGDFVFVREGATQAATGWVQINQPATIGTDPIAFSQFSGAGTYTAGNGLDLTGNVFSVNAGTGIYLTGDAVTVNTNVIASSITDNGAIVYQQDGKLKVRLGTGLVSQTDGMLGTNSIAINMSGLAGFGLRSFGESLEVNSNALVGSGLYAAQPDAFGNTVFAVNTNVVAQSLIGTGLYVTGGDNLTVNTNALAGPLAGDGLASTGGQLNVTPGLHLLVNTITNALDVNARAVVTAPSAGTATWVADSLNAYDYGATSFYIANNAAKSLRKVDQAATQVSNTYVTIATIDFGGTANPTMFSADIVLSSGASVRTSKISGTVDNAIQSANYTEYAIVEQGNAMSDVDVRVEWSGALSAWVLQAKASLGEAAVLRGVAEVTAVGFWT